MSFIYKPVLVLCDKFPGGFAPLVTALPSILDPKVIRLDSELKFFMQWTWYHYLQTMIGLKLKT